MYKNVKFNNAEGPKALEIIKEAIPIPGDNEVVVQMKAAGLNRSEHMYMNGVYVIDPVFPSLIGTEGSGVIHTRGKNVTDFSIGDAVCITPNILPNEYGVIGEYVLIPKEALVPKPQNLSFEESASVWMSLTTAYCGLIMNGGLKNQSGQTVVVTAASAPIGVAAMQMAKKYGATVIATSRTSQKDAFLLENGADYIIHSDQEDISERILAITNSNGFDIALDLVLGSFTGKLALAASQHATIVAGGILSMEIPQLPFFPVVMKNLKIVSFHVVFHLLRNPEAFKKAEKEIFEGLQSNTYRPVIDKIFSLDQVAEAYEYFGTGNQRGKVVITI
ncbi:zinc-dependent alcohol dehydrogenase family protein [Aquimarina sp. 2304DJ70-9]|uniref:zinc-dependent alcohol dehydrogenase family protein n=1 Tax=Aquimarina penaris TaxID=3231044 RepID=UPI003461C603